MTIEKVLSTSPLQILETEILLSFLLKKDRSYLFAHKERDLSESQTAKLTKLIEARASGKPLAYILGYKEFFGLNFLVNSSVLIPRQETEDLVEEALKFLKTLERPVVIDIGTGSGCIAISLAKNLPTAKIIATDISAAALEVAEKNAKLHSLEKRIQFLKSDLLTGINTSQKVNLIVANLPYIPTKRLLTLKKEVKDFEPAVALDSANSPTTFYDKLFKQAQSLLKPQGKILYEIDGKVLTKVF